MNTGHIIMYLSILEVLHDALHAVDWSRKVQLSPSWDKEFPEAVQDAYTTGNNSRFCSFRCPEYGSVADLHAHILKSFLTFHLWSHLYSSHTFRGEFPCTFPGDICLLCGTGTVTTHISVHVTLFPAKNIGLFFQLTWQTLGDFKSQCSHPGGCHWRPEAHVICPYAVTAHHLCLVYPCFVKWLILFSAGSPEEVSLTSACYFCFVLKGGCFRNERDCAITLMN